MNYGWTNHALWIPLFIWRLWSVCLGSDRLDGVRCTGCPLMSKLISLVSAKALTGWLWGALGCACWLRRKLWGGGGRWWLTACLRRSLSLWRVWCTGRIRWSLLISRVRSSFWNSDAYVLAYMQSPGWDSKEMSQQSRMLAAEQRGSLVQSNRVHCVWWCLTPTFLWIRPKSKSYISMEKYS